MLLLVLGVAVLSTGVVIAQNGGLPHFAPRSVAQLPLSSEAPKSIKPNPRWMEIAEIEKRAEFTIVLPSDLPKNCVPTERFYNSMARGTYLNYSCALILERKAVGVEHPLVGSNSTKQLTIGGNPAILIDGMWISERLGSPAEWETGFKTLIFEKKGLVIQIRTGNLSESELIRFAESMD